MTRGERERWNKLSDRAKGMTRVLAQYADAGKAHLNDLRLHEEMRGLSSREIIGALRELQSRSYGRLDDAAGPDPVFVMNVPALQTLAQTHRITNQAPHILSGGDNG